MIWMLIVASTCLIAQDIQVSGLVTDDSGKPLVGVSVALLGGSQGTITNGSGEYALKVSPEGILQFSMVGYNRKEVEVLGKTQIDVSLTAGIHLTEIAVIGSRNARRIATETVVPVDRLDVHVIAQGAPQISLSQVLNYVAPSFSSNPQTISDGTDHVDPASLRGMGPDQVLVLVNGKRRHTSSLVNINGTVGRGSVGTDLNAIPVAAIETIEVLRDGAAAQYGSDAIAGIINIILKEQTSGLDVSYTSGANVTSEAETVDGQQHALTANLGLPIGKSGGIINLTGSVNLREPTDRTGDFEGQIFNRYNSIERMAQLDGKGLSSLTEGELIFYANQLGYVDSTQILDGNLGPLQSFLNDDVTEEELLARGFSRTDFNMRTGQSKFREAKMFVNMRLPVGTTAEVYAFGGLSYRDGNSGGFYRLPYQSRTYTPLYLNGFIPEINSQVVDQSLVVGIKGDVGSWQVDFSHAYGFNSFNYVIGNTNNASMESDSPISFDAGGHSFMQNTTNLDVSRNWSQILSGFNMAWGIEHRLENFMITAGEQASYSSYDINGQLVTANTPDSLLVRDFFGNIRQGAAQVFPGFSPDNELDRFRNSFATYADFELDVTEKFLVNTAVRFENYSDFGSTFNYKFAARYLLSKKFMVRAAHSTGFRAPSLHQLYFNRVSTQFVAGVPYEIGTFSNDSKIARLLGIPELKQERSQNVSAGLSMKLPDLGLTMTIDGFYIKLFDRVTYTGAFNASNSAEDAELAAILNQVGASSATFFANSIDVVSQGVDLVITHFHNWGEMRMTTSLSGTVSKTEQVGDIHASSILANKLDTYFSPYDRIFLESASPKTKAHFSLNIAYRKLSVVFRES